MNFRTEGILRTAEGLPKDESSINNAEREFGNDTDAHRFFEGLKRKLFDISHWNHRSGLSNYKLFDQTGNVSADNLIRRGSFIMITLHGSGKSDWVHVEDVLDSETEAVITVRPTYDPTDKPANTGKISHFFTSDATNNFCAFQHGNIVTMYVIGLNERLNSGHADGMIEKVRNAVVANAGSYLGIQSAEWSKFCKSFLFDDEEPSAE